MPNITCMKKKTGFTLVELMVTLAVLAIVLTLGVPSFTTFIQNSRLITGANEFATALSLARTTAIKEGAGAVIQAPTTSPSSNEWGQGFTVSVWTDADNDNVVDSGEVGVAIRTFKALDATVTLDSTTGVRTIAFVHTGQLTGTTALLFNLCDSRTGETGRQFTLNAIGSFDLDRGYTCP